MSSDEIPSEWRTTHLVVLVGANPLPNFIAARLLLADGGTLHLLHSPDTCEIANRIGQRFKLFQTHEIQDPADSTEIRTVVKGVVGECSDGSIGLNYTGGTKAMAVHAYETISRAAPKVVLTYLDARTLSLHRSDCVKPSPVKYAIMPRIIDDVLALHAIKLNEKHPVRRQPRRMLLNQALARAHATVDGQDAYEAWCQRYLRYLPDKDLSRCRQAVAELLPELSAGMTSPEELCARLIPALRSLHCCAGELVKKPKDFGRTPILFPTDPALREVAEVMRDLFGVQGDAFDPSDVIANPQVELESVGDLVKYLDGDWVEHLALAALIDNKDACRLHDWAMSMRTITDPYDFEFDVAAMQGYQLYAISCTRSADRGLCKGKLFEAYVRAAQLGGDEARVGLVCCDKDPARLQQQVTELWRVEKQRIRVFGPRDIAHLPERFCDWLSR